MHRIKLSNNEFEGKNNSYLYKRDQNILVDTGINIPGTADQLRQELRDNGVEFSDIDHVLLTHWHGDHVGLAGEIQQESGAEVYIGEHDADIVEQAKETWMEMRDLQKTRFREWGMPQEMQDELMAFLSGGPTIMGEPPSVTRVSDGETLSIGGIKFKAVHTPGHTDGHLSYEINEDEEVIHTGDALLPVYTPNVGGADLRVEEPLRKYIDTLQRIKEGGYSVAYPGHRDPIEDPAGRASDIITHHYERSRRILNVLEREGAMDAWSVGAELFGELESIHIMHGPGESFSHLDHMHRNDVVEVVEDRDLYADVDMSPESIKYDVSDDAWSLLDECLPSN